MTYLARLTEVTNLRAMFRAAPAAATEQRRSIAALLGQYERDAVRTDSTFAVCCEQPACDCSAHVRSDATDHTNPDYQRGLEHARQKENMPQDPAAVTSAAARKRLHLAAYEPLHDGPPTAEEQARFDAAEKAYDARVAEDKARRSHVVARLDKQDVSADIDVDADDKSRAKPGQRSAATTCSTCDKGLTTDDIAGSAKQCAVCRARSRSNTRMQNAWKRGPVNAQEQRAIDLRTDPDDEPNTAA